MAKRKFNNTGDRVMSEVEEIMKQKEQEIRCKLKATRLNDTYRMNRALLFCDLSTLEKLASMPKLKSTIHAWAKALKRRVENLGNLDPNANPDYRLEQIERIIKEST